MTLGEAKERVLQLLDEYGYGGDEELEGRMIGLIDMAQKRLAGIQKTVKAVDVDCGAGEWSLPADALGFYRLWVNGRLARSLCWVGEKLLLPTNAKSATAEYFALPESVNEGSMDTMVLGIPETAAVCLPFLVAGELLCADMVQDGSALLNLYRQMAAELDTTLPGTAQGRVKNEIFGGRI